MIYLAPPMRYKLLLPLLVLLFCSVGCKKDDAPLLEALLRAECRDCLVRYATGVLQSKSDTLTFRIDPDNGDTLPGRGTWEVHVKEGENLFFQACYLEPDSAQGPILLQITGEAGTYEAAADTSAECAAINRVVP